MSRLIDENDIIKMLNTMDRYTSEELTLCDTDKTFPMNEVFIVDDVFEGLDELPSAQPEVLECGEGELSAQPDSKETSSTHKALDTISRQAVIDALTHKWDGMVTSVFDVVKSLPSAQPEEIDSESCNELKKMCEELKAHIEYLRRQNDSMKGEIKALIFAVRCCGVSGNEVQYESD